MITDGCRSGIPWHPPARSSPAGAPARSHGVHSVETSVENIKLRNGRRRAAFTPRHRLRPCGDFVARATPSRPPNVPHIRRNDAGKLRTSRPSRPRIVSVYSRVLSSLVAMARAMVSSFVRQWGHDAQPRLRASVSVSMRQHAKTSFFDFVLPSPPVRCSIMFSRR